jgi:hypothetical protein
LPAISLQKAQFGDGTYPDKRSLFAPQVALFDKIVAKETSVPEGQAYKALLCERAKKSLPKQITVNVNTI